MGDITIEQTEEEILACDISDEVLESAAAIKDTEAVTWSFCTGLAACPST